MRGVIVMQFWKGDQAEAAEAARLIADVEKCKREDFDFVFAYRKGATVDYKTIQYVEEKFHQVLLFEGRRKETGWPNGCNALWAEVIDYVYRMQRDHGAEWDMVLTIEPDVVPTRPDWINALKDAWKARKDDTVCMGHKYEGNHAVAPHVNGNAIFCPNISKKIKGIAQGTPHNWAWDIYWASRGLLERGEDTGLVVNQYKQENATPEKLFQERIKGVAPAFVHGYRDDTARRIIRSRLPEWAKISE